MNQYTILDRLTQALAGVGLIFCVLLFEGMIAVAPGGHDYAKQEVTMQLPGRNR